MIQIVFNEISAAELSRLPTQIQFHLLEALNIQPGDLEEDRLAKRFGLLERGNKKLYRCRAGDHRIYFAVKDGNVRLTGTIDSGWDRLQAVRAARSVRGVTAVHDDLMLAGSKQETPVL